MPVTRSAPTPTLTLVGSSAGRASGASGASVAPGATGATGVEGALPRRGPATRAEFAGPVPAAPPGTPAGAPVQLGLDDLGTPLHEVTFVVVDLETTGGSPATSAITEIGAVKVRGGEVLGELQTLVDPGSPIPPQITVLTGITTAMVIGAPRIETVLPTFLEFAGLDRGAVLVAHNARFDVGFLKAAAAATGHPWPGPPVLDTVALARRVVTRDEAPNVKLATLAALFGARQTPDHRALHDARATVDVLHALLGRLGGLGVTHLEDLPSATDPVPLRRRRKSGLADGLTRGPGVYQFFGPDAKVLYVGSAVDVRRRVRSYFTAAEKRARIGEMVDLAVGVRAVPCATQLEARVRELRLIAELDPPYNRRSRRPAQRPWVRLTDEPHPRLSLVRRPTRADLGVTFGPFASAREATAAMEAVQEATGVRRCTTRLPATPRPDAPCCALAELGRCAAPCRPDGARPARAADAPGGVSVVEQALAGHIETVLGPVRARIAALAADQRYEDAAVARDRMIAYVRGARRAERLGPLLAHPEILAARRRTAAAGGWELVLVRHGRLAGTAVAPRGTDPLAVCETLRLTGDVTGTDGPIAHSVSPEETEMLADWLDSPGVRLVSIDESGPPLTRPLAGAGTAERLLRAASQGPPGGA